MYAHAPSSVKNAQGAQSSEARFGHVKTRHDLWSSEKGCSAIMPVLETAEHLLSSSERAFNTLPSTCATLAFGVFADRVTQPNTPCRFGSSTNQSFLRKVCERVSHLSVGVTDRREPRYRYGACPRLRLDQSDVVKRTGICAWPPAQYSNRRLRRRSDQNRPNTITP
jgi:hypothetical protein